MYALVLTTLSHFLCGNYAAAMAQSDELLALAGEKGASVLEGVRNDDPWLRAGPDRETRRRSSNDYFRDQPHGDRQEQHCMCHCFYYIWREPMRNSVNSMMLGADCEAMTAMETTKERWFEAELHRIAGEIALRSPQQDPAKAEAYFECALAVARHSKQNPGNSAPP